ncbi:hypothetical protein D3C72_1897020 [compost metagenome]
MKQQHVEKNEIAGRKLSCFEAWNEKKKGDAKLQPQRGRGCGATERFGAEESAPSVTRDCFLFNETGVHPPLAAEVPQRFHRIDGVAGKFGVFLRGFHRSFDVACGDLGSVVAQADEDAAIKQRHKDELLADRRAEHCQRYADLQRSRNETAKKRR